MRYQLILIPKYLVKLCDNIPNQTIADIVAIQNVTGKHFLQTLNKTNVILKNIF